MLPKRYIVILVLISSILFGQSNSSSIFLQGDQNIVDADQFGYRNYLNISQVGDLSTSLIEQEGIGNYYIYRDIHQINKNFDLAATQFDLENSILYRVNNANLVNVFQTGNVNGVIISNAGANNNTDIVQDGIANNYTATYLGNEISVNGTQIGRENLIVQDIFTNSVDIEVLQDGNYNTIININNSILGQNLVISQSGNWMKAIIVNGNVIH